ncbi:hypothetical protein JXA59_02690 [Patescibacteria group bacterium]|nr:hypothetical protein [Patescibacteria group bacterium]
MKYLYWLIGLVVLGGIGFGSYYLGRSAAPSLSFEKESDDATTAAPQPATLVDLWGNDTMDINIAQMTYEGERVSYFKDSADKRLGLPMTRAQSLQLDRELRRAESGATSYEPQMDQEAIWDDVIAKSPLDGGVLLFTSVEGYGSAIEAEGPITSRIYAFDSSSRVLSKLFENKNTSSKASTGGFYPAAFYEIIATYGDKLILHKDYPENSPGPCFNWWLNNDGFYSLNISSPAGLSKWQPPASKISQEQAQQRACESESF